MQSQASPCCYQSVDTNTLDWSQQKLDACSTASSHSHDSPAPNHVTAQLFNILDEPLAETAATSSLQVAPPSAAWDAFAAPPAASGTSLPESMSWSAFDNGTPVSAPSPVLTPNHQLPPKQYQHQQQEPDLTASWAAFVDSSSQPQPQQPQPQQLQQPSPQQQQQQLQRAPEAVAAPQPPKPAPRQELPLVSLFELATCMCRLKEHHQSSMVTLPLFLDTVMLCALFGVDTFSNVTSETWWPRQAAV